MYVYKDIKQGCMQVWKQYIIFYLDQGFSNFWMGVPLHLIIFISIILIGKDIT